MGTQVTLTLPDEVYQQAESLAQATNQPIAEVLVDVIEQAFTPMMPVNENRPKMQEQVAAFEAMHAELWQTYPHQYVAFHEGQLIDHDDDKIALIMRIDEQYPGKVVMIRQVMAELPPVLRVRSPRLVR